MVSESIDDVEGEVLRRLRAAPGLSQVPLFGVFDLHANLTEAMTQLADGLVCYRENPHIDARDTAVRAAELLARSLATGARPRMRRRSVPVIWPPTGTGTADLPMRELEALAREIEAADPEIWAVNVVAGFSFADVADAGVAFSVVTTGDERTAAAALDRLEARATALKAHGLVPEITPDAALDRAAAFAGRGPVLLVEPSDNIGGGAPGNGTGLLRALVRRGIDNAGVIINDPDAVAALAEVPLGGRATVAIGGKGNPFDAGPLALEVDLVRRSDGRFDLEDLHSHLIASQGRHIDMGPSVVVRHRGVTILITTHKTPPNDLGQWRSQGIDPEDFAVIGIKAGVAHRRAYDPIAAASFNVATPGPCASDPAALPYRRLRRPIFPLDPL
jgi:microcystin degradation protein MlrC